MIIMLNGKRIELKFQTIRSLKLQYELKLYTRTGIELKQNFSAKESKQNYAGNDYWTK